jgi:hypothetical protein
MNFSDIVKHRLVNQQIADKKFQSAQKLLEWMGAMQAQDYNMVKWGIGARIPNSLHTQILDEFNKGKILRTHLMRPTWHMVSSNDIYWMLQLTVPQIKTVTKTRHKDLGLTHEVINKSLNIIEKSLEREGHLTREELIGELTRAKIQTDNNRASHIMLCAEMEKLVCSGPVKNEKQTYALLEKRVEKRISLYPDEALCNLAAKYFQSHGPASIDDFVWWSGLKVADAKKGLEMNKKDLSFEKIKQETYWFKESQPILDFSLNSVYLLPAFDEYIISYRHRHAAVVFEDSRKVMSSNGIFRPIIVINGQVSGVWKREIRRDKVLIEIDLFDAFNDETILRVKEQVEQFASFVGAKPEIQFKKQKPLK